MALTRSIDSTKVSKKIYIVNSNKQISILFINKTILKTGELNRPRSLQKKQLESVITDLNTFFIRFLSIGKFPLHILAVITVNTDCCCWYKKRLALVYTPSVTTV